LKTRKTKTGELDLFKSIWLEREHISFLSGRSIKWFDIKAFAHVVAKSKLPEARLDKNNIILLHPEEHNLEHIGTNSQREKYCQDWNCSWDKITNYKKKIEQKYEYSTD